MKHIFLQVGFWSLCLAAVSLDAQATGMQLCAEIAADFDGIEPSAPDLNDSYAQRLITDVLQRPVDGVKSGVAANVDGYGYSGSQKERISAMPLMQLWISKKAGVYAHRSDRSIFPYSDKYAQANSAFLDPPFRGRENFTVTLPAGLETYAEAADFQIENLQQDIAAHEIIKSKRARISGLMDKGVASLGSSDSIAKYIAGMVEETSLQRGEDIARRALAIRKLGIAYYVYKFSSDIGERISALDMVKARTRNKIAQVYEYADKKTSWYRNSKLSEVCAYYTHVVPDPVKKKKPEQQASN